MNKPLKDGSIYIQMNRNALAVEATQDCSGSAFVEPSG